MKKIQISIFLCAIILLCVCLCSCEEISLDKTSITLKVDETFQMEADFESSDDGDLEWSSSDKSIAKVDVSGKVTAVSDGTCIITATTPGGKTASCTVTVEALEPTELKLTQKSMSLAKNAEKKISYSILPKKAKNQTVTFESSDEDIATVGTDGTVVAKGVGKCEITVTTYNDISETVEIVVLPDLQGAYDEYCDSVWAEIASDGSYLSLDTNPYDLDDYYNASRVSAIENINKFLGLPSSVYQKMLKTTWSQGKQTHTDAGLTVTWTYHPDKGLEIIYEVDED